jgi:hypothetical protein
MAEVSQANVPVAGWRLKLGVALFGLSVLLPVLGVPRYRKRPDERMGTPCNP